MTDINSTENKIQIKKESVENKSEETKWWRYLASTK